MLQELAGLVTPFTDTVRVEFDTEWAETPPGPKGAFGTTSITLCLARGMWRMARRNALVEQLAAVESQV